MEQLTSTPTITFVIGQTFHRIVPAYPRKRQVVVQVAGLVGRAIGLHAVASDGERGPRGRVFGDAKFLRNLHDEIGADRISGRRRDFVAILDLLDDRLALLAST